MELSSVVATQVLIMFLVILLGFIIKKSKIVTQKGAKQLSDILLLFVTPCVIIESYQVDFRADLAFKLIIAFAFAVIIMFLAVGVARLVYFKDKSQAAIINKFAMAYPNCGFMGIPLLDAVLGSTGVFFGSAYVAVFNVFNWTHGVVLFNPDKKGLSIKKILINPGIIGVTVGLILFFAQIKLPYVVFTAVSYIADLNTPLAMVLIGMFLADVDFKAAFCKINLYIVSAFRLIIIPIIAIFILKLSFVPQEVATALIILASCPTATVTTLFAAKYDNDACYASELVAINTLVSILTLPLMVAFATLIPALF